MKITKNLLEHYTVSKENGMFWQPLFEQFNTPTLERLARKYAAPLVMLMPAFLAKLMTDFAKYLRNKSKELKLFYPLDFAENRRILTALDTRSKSPWWGYRAVVCISHDVDNAKGYHFVKQMAKIDKAFGFTSTFNFLTHADYQIESDLLDWLQAEGFEIGLHGYNHDQGFAFRSLKEIRKKLGMSLTSLGKHRARGIRTPALSRSRNFFSSLKSNGFTYDSSMQIGSPFYPSVKLPYPFYYEDLGIWEIPLMIQDDNYLRDSRVSETEMVSSLNRYLTETTSLNGVMVINLHPHLMDSRIELYQRILNLFKTNDQIAIKNTGEVAQYAQDNSISL